MFLTTTTSNEVVSQVCRTAFAAVIILDALTIAIMRTPRGPGFPLRMAVSLGSLLLLLASLCNASLSSSLSDDALVLEGTNVGDEGSSVNNWAVLVCTSRYWYVDYAAAVLDRTGITMAG